MKPEELIALLGPSSGYRPGRLRIETGTASSPSEAETLLSGLIADGANGWVARQSGVQIFPGESSGALGGVIDAELGTASSSLQLRRVGSAWIWTSITDGDGTDVLVDEVDLVTTSQASARYRRYWRLPDDGSVEIIACRLVRILAAGESAA